MRVLPLCLATCVLAACERAQSKGPELEVASPPVLPTENKANACGAGLSGGEPPDLYRAITRGDADEKALASLWVLKLRDDQSRTLVRRALATVAADPGCKHLRLVTDVLEDGGMDSATRAAAALALGAIARDFPCTFPGSACPPPHDPIPNWANRSLQDCARSAQWADVMVQRACVEALGYVHSTPPSLLLSLRDTAGVDTMVRVFAGRALTRLTGIPSVSGASLDQLVDDAQQVGTP